jgi:hypothetical protein
VLNHRFVKLGAETMFRLTISMQDAANAIPAPLLAGLESQVHLQ